jgi:ElaB/YqjD/DUF883 family membrane-anchored ribosome-binding protein
MPTDSVLSRELQLLQEELSASQREHSAAAAIRNASGAAATGKTPLPAATAELCDDDEQDFGEQLSELADEITGFFEQAQKNLSAHPIEGVAGALLIGILIGRLLGRR